MTGTPRGTSRGTARAPGRVNLVGDHTDYTGGLCLPMAIDRWVEVSVQWTGEADVVRLRSEQEPGEAVVPLSVPADGPNGVGTLEPPWARYVAGVVAELRPSRGMTGVVRSTVPAGSGLSSSAALEVACALALGADPSDRLALAQLCRRAEHLARGVPTGILDQLSSVSGVDGHALVLDCASLTVTPTPMPPPDEGSIVVVQGPPRSLGSTGYAARVRECAEVEAQIGPLPAATLDDVARIADPVLRARARHVVSENARVGALARALASGDLVAAGRIMDESHASLSGDYDCSTPAMDGLQASVRAVPGVLGARMTGGGWGGCVVALCRPGALASWDGGRAWAVRAVDGASVSWTR